MLLHLLKNKLKVLLRSKELIFWTLIFPILLGVFFKLALSNIANEQDFKVIKIAVVENQELNQEKNLNEVIKSLSQQNENQVFETTYVENKEKAEQLLNDSEISGFIIMDENKKVDINVNDTGIEQTIIKYVIDEYYQMTSVAAQAIDYNPKVLYNGTLEKLAESKEYLDNKSSDNLDFCLNYYYTLIAMACIYGGFFRDRSCKRNRGKFEQKSGKSSSFTST